MPLCVSMAKFIQIFCFNLKSNEFCPRTVVTGFRQRQVRLTTMPSVRSNQILWLFHDPEASVSTCCRRSQQTCEQSTSGISSLSGTFWLLRLVILRGPAGDWHPHVSGLGGLDWRDCSNFPPFMSWSVFFSPLFELAQVFPVSYYSEIRPWEGNEICDPREECSTPTWQPERTHKKFITRQHHSVSCTSP